jgi:hypothetical protein
MRICSGAQHSRRRCADALRAVRSTFVGFYADLSLLEADKPYPFVLELPNLKAGQFRGLYFENVEPEYVSTVNARRP